MKKYYMYKFIPTDEITVVSVDDDIADEVSNIIMHDERYEIITTLESTSSDKFFISMAILGVNKALKQLGVDVFFAKVDDCGDFCFEIRLVNKKMIDHYTVNMNNGFFRIIEDIFTKFDLKFEYNNIKSDVFISRKETE